MVLLLVGRTCRRTTGRRWIIKVKIQSKKSKKKKNLCLQFIHLLLCFLLKFIDIEKLGEPMDQWEQQFNVIFVLFFKMKFSWECTARSIVTWISDSFFDYWSAEWIIRWKYSTFPRSQVWWMVCQTWFREGSGTLEHSGRSILSVKYLSANFK